MNGENFIRTLLKEADIEINGTRPWDIRILNEKVFLRILREGALGFGESYMDNWWESDDLEETIYKILKAHLPGKIKYSSSLFLRTGLRAIEGFLGKVGKKASAFEVGKHHYDIGNDLYTKMLDSGMNYSCGYWKSARTLEQAQEAKLDLICRKFHLQKGMRVLDIGCGWGGFLFFSAKKYGVSGVGITVSNAQAEFARTRLKDLPVEIRVQDYRDISAEPFERIVSIGMFEHVGYRYYPDFMKKVASLLTPNGIFILHTIGANKPSTRGDEWFEKYIFPNSMMPAISQTESASRHLFILEDLQNFGPYYTLTLRAWFKNFEKAWPELKGKYDERFYRMWKFYLLSSAAAFRVRSLQLWQLVFRKRGTEEVYNSVR